MLARESSDLGDVRGAVGDIDWVRACGMVAQRFGTALAVWRLCEQGERRALHEAFDGLMAMCCRLHVMSDPHAVTSRVLQWMLDPRCPECHGRKFTLMHGAPKLSEQPCPACEGAGMRSRAEWGEHEFALHDALLADQARAAAAIRAKLGGQ